MLWIYLIVLQIFFFIGLLFFLRYVLTRNISKATGHLHDLSKDFISKEEEANRLLQKARSEAKVVLAREAQAGEEAREKMVQEAQAQRDQIIREANQRSAEITEKAERNAEFVRVQLQQKIDERAKSMVRELIHQVIPQDFLRETHERWLSTAEKGELDLRHLKLADTIKEVKIFSAFPLTDKQRDDLAKKLTKKVGNAVAVADEVDPLLLAGYMIKIGSVVVDASLRYKIEKAMQK